MVSPDTSRLSVEGVSASYGARRVLDDFHITIAPGELVAVLGHNGAGKTTALRVISGLKSPSSGTVTLDGVPLSGASTHSRARRGLGVVPEGVAGLFPTLTVRQNLESVVPTRGASRTEAWAAMDDRLNDLFEEVLVAKRNQIAGSMSGGQRQMLAIAVALARRPSVLLLDEPSTGLAPIIVDRILNAIEVLVQTTGTSVVLVEQNLANALRVSNRAVIVNSGRVAAELQRGEFPDPTELWKYF